jgi:hypothetical protein
MAMRPESPPPDPIRDFVEQLLSTGLMLGDLLGDLLDSLPADAFPGEVQAEVLIEMLTGSVRPVVEAAGPVEEVTALLGAVGDKALEDLRRAAELAG